MEGFSCGGCLVDPRWKGRSRALAWWAALRLVGDGRPRRGLTR